MGLYNYAVMAWGVIAFILLAISWRYARKSNIKAHKKLMTLLTLGAWVFILSYLTRFYLPAYTPVEISKEMIPWLAFHGTTGLVPLFGSTALLYARLRCQSSNHLNRRHKFYGRGIAGVWFFTHIGGIANFWLIG